MFSINVEVAEITAYNIISKAEDPFSVVKLIENTKEVLVQIFYAKDTTKDILQQRSNKGYEDFTIG